MHPELDCGTADWDYRVYGNHRIVVAVRIEAGAVQTELPWRRHDPVTLATAGVVVVSLRSGRRVRNAVVTAADPERGHLLFEPLDGPGEYAVHYLPYVDSGSHWYPQASYVKRLSTADPTWTHRHHIDRPDGWVDLPVARAVRYEAASALDSFAPLGFAATAAETAKLLADHPDAGFVLFGEDRRHGIGRASYLPARWARGGVAEGFEGTADRGEFYVFQVGLYAVRDLADVRVTIDLPFPARSLAHGGTDARGNGFDRTVSVGAGHVQSLWIGVEVPPGAQPGAIDGSVGVCAAGETRELPVRLEITDRVVDDHGAGDLDRLARLGWLDSTLAQDDEVVAPFQPVRVDGRTLHILGRSVDLAASGLPEQIRSHFTPRSQACTTPDATCWPRPSPLPAAMTGRSATWRSRSPVRPGRSGL